MNEIKSTLPAKIGGAEITRFNALRHGLLSRYTLLGNVTSTRKLAGHIECGIAREHEARIGAGVRVEYPRSTWLCASASRSRDSESRGKNVFRSGSIPSSSSSVPRGVSVAVGVNSLKLGNMLPFGQRPGDRPIYPRRRAV
jgi:hypothetical protein